MQDLVYQHQAGKDWLARVYQPKGSGPFPTIVDVHGGAWNRGDRLGDAAINEALAARGVLVAAIDFRQPPEAGYPASVQDLNLAIRWLKSKAPELNGKPEVGAIGASSGGHLVVLAGMKPRDPRYAALPLPGQPNLDASLKYVVACWPVIDPLYRYRMAKQQGRTELVASHDAYWGSEDAHADGSPYCIMDRQEKVETPPVLLVLKANDANHPIEMQEAFAASYRKLGGAVDMPIFDAATLPSPFVLKPETQPVLDTILGFVKKHDT